MLGVGLFAHILSFYLATPGGDSNSNFGLSPGGVLRVKKDLDREYIPLYSIIIKASSNKNWGPTRAQRSSRVGALDPSHDPTLQEVRIYLEDINDQPPRFTKLEYTAGICLCGLDV